MALFDSDDFKDNEGTVEIHSHVTGHNGDSSMKMSSLFCVNHSDKEVIYFCKQHKVDCCEMCLSKHHKQCTVIPIDDINSEFFIFLKNVNRAKDNIEGVAQHLTLQSNKINSHTKLAETKIRLFYNEIRLKVDEAERESLKKLHKLREDTISTISSHYDEYKRMKEQINDVIENGERLFNKTNKGDSEASGRDSEPNFNLSLNADRNTIVQFSILNKSNVELIQKQVSDENEWSQKINVDFLSVDESLIDKLISYLKRSVRLSPFHPALPKPPVCRFIADKRIQYTGIPYSIHTISGSDEGFFILSQLPNTIQRINISGKVLGKLNLPTIPNDLSVYSDSIALTFGRRMSIKLYKVSTFIEYSEIKTSGQCYGICRSGDSFTVTFHKDGLVRNVGDSGNVINSSGYIFKNPSHVNISNDNKHILVSDTGNNRVVVLSANLQKILFTILHPELKIPRGLSTDMYGSIYVCSQDTNSVIKFTSDGTYDSTIITGTIPPRDLCFNRLNTTLAVIIQDLWESVIQVYKVERC